MTEQKAAWLRARRKCITASDVPAILGASPFASPFSVYAEKVGLVDPPDLDDNPRVRAGTLLEPVVAKWAAEDLGLALENRGKYHLQKHPSLPWLGATIDRFVVGVLAQPDECERPVMRPLFEREQKILEIKTSGLADEWSEDEPPTRVLLQVAAQLCVTNLDEAIVAALIQGQRLHTFTVYRDRQFEERMLAALAAFWDRVQKQDPPPVDGTDATTEAVKALTRSVSKDKVIDLPSDFAALDDRVQTIRAQMKALETEEAELTNRLKVALGDAEVGLLPSGVAWSFKTVSRKAYTVEAQERRELRRKAARKA